MAFYENRVLGVGEKTLEKRLNQEVKVRGGKTIKLSSPNQRGVPDRIVLFPRGRAWFVELKTTGKKLTPLQQKWFVDLEGLEFPCRLVDSHETLLAFLKEVEGVDGVQVHTP